MKERWKSVCIKDVARVVNGGTPKTKVSDYWGGHHLWITPAEMGRLVSPYLHESKRKLTDAGLQNCSASLVPAHSVILSTRAPIGHLVINSVPMAFNQGCRGLVPSEKILYKYLYYFLGFSVDLLNDLGSGTTFKELSAGKLKSVEIPLPSLPEQKRIVAILDEAFAGIDTAIANTEKNLANARELFESYLNSVFTQGGDRWESSILGDVYDVRDGTHDSPKYQSSGRALVTSKNLKSGSLDLSNVKCISEEDYQSICRRSAVHKGDVLLAMIGTIGNPIVVENEPDYAIKNVALFKVPKDRSGHFLRYYLMSQETVKKMAREAKGTTQKFVGLGYLRNFPIQLPDNNQEQLLVEAIAEYEGIARNLESIYQQKLTALAELKQSLLQKAFSGQLTADAADAVETVEAELA